MSAEYHRFYFIRRTCMSDAPVLCHIIIIIYSTQRTEFALDYVEREQLKINDSWNAGRFNLFAINCPRNRDEKSKTKWAVVLNLFLRVTWPRMECDGVLMISRLVTCVWTLQTQMRNRIRKGFGEWRIFSVKFRYSLSAFVQPVQPYDLLPGALLVRSLPI